MNKFWVGFLIPVSNSGPVSSNGLKRKVGFTELKCILKTKKRHVVKNRPDVIRQSNFIQIFILLFWESEKCLSCFNGYVSSIRFMAVCGSFRKEIVVLQSGIKSG